MKKRILIVLAALFAVGTFTLVTPSCGGLSVDSPADSTPTNTDTSDALATLVADNFNAATAETLKTSVISMPESLSVASFSAAQKPGNTGSAVKRMAGGGGGYPDMIYGGIRNYIGLADMMKDMVKDILSKIIPNLGNMPVGVLTEIPPNASDPEAPKYVKLEQGTTYDWKVSLYFTDNVTPELIMRFTNTATGTKGRMLMNMAADSSEFTDCGYTGEFIRTVDVTFDGTVVNKIATSGSIEVKLIQDLSGLLAYADTLDLTNTAQATQYASCDLGQPSKVFLNATYDGTEYTIYGTSYHSGWAAQFARLGDAAGPSFGDGRSMYMFKAKATDTDGAKLYLALPVDTMTDTTNVWTTDSISEIFGQVVANELEKAIQSISDGTFLGDLAALTVMKLIVPDATTHTHQITTAELLAFAQGSGTLPAQLGELQSMVLSVLSLVNPAFYTEADADGDTHADGFLGTLNESTSTYYKYANSALTDATSDAAFKSAVNTLNAYDLSSVVNYVPATVKAATITVE